MENGIHSDLVFCMHKKANQPITKDSSQEVCSAGTSRSVLGRIRLTSLVGALLLFIFPWIDIQCSAQTVATQNGLQTVIGDYTISNQLNVLGQEIGKGGLYGSRSLGVAPLVGVALVALIGALCFAGLALYDPGERSGVWAVVLSGVALLCLVVQMLAGFPIGNSIADKDAENHQISLENWSSEMLKMSDRAEEMEEQVVEPVSGIFRAKTTVVFYLELLLLSVPLLLLMFRASWVSPLGQHDQDRY